MIRPVAIGVPFSGGAILAAAVTEDDGTRKGWRPLGGGIEFGETAEAAVLREFHEELQARARILRRVGIIENLFEHHNAQGHEIVFAFELALDDPGIAQGQRFVLKDEGFRCEAAWIDLARFREGEERLLPDGLLPLL